MRGYRPSHVAHDLPVVDTGDTNVRPARRAVEIDEIDEALKKCVSLTPSLSVPVERLTNVASKCGRLKNRKAAIEKTLDNPHKVKEMVNEQYGNQLAKQIDEMNASLKSCRKGCKK